MKNIYIYNISSYQAAQSKSDQAQQNIAVIELLAHYLLNIDKSSNVLSCEVVAPGSV